MSSALDMSLDDIINKNKKPSKRSRGSGESGPSRRPPSRSANRAAPYATARKAPESAWQHDLYSEQTARLPAPAGARAAAIETGTKLYVSNLDYGVSNDDIKELFAEVGDLKRSSVHYDRSGRSKGTADVVFSRRSDALAAVKRYNNVQLDGKPMKIEIVGTNISTPAAGPLVSNGGFENPNGFARSGPANIATRVGSTRGPRGGGGRGRNTGRGRGGGKSRAEPLSASNLDADLEKYHQEAMQTN